MVRAPITARNKHKMKRIQSLSYPIVHALSCAFALAAQGGDWPGFRGPLGNGVSSEEAPVLAQSVITNVLWKSEIPGLGWSSPVVQGERVFVTTATKDGAACHVLALDAKSGKTLWDREVFEQSLKRKEGKNSFATPTPVVDGERVYAVFCDGGIAALTLDGKPAWTNRDYPFYSQHGLGASPVQYKDLLIMSYDGSSESGDKTAGWQKPWEQSFIVALDKATGKERWKARRGPSRIAHVTSAIIEVNGKPLLASGAGDVIQGFNPDNGERVWTVFSQGEGVVPSIVPGDGLVYAASGFPNKILRAVRTDGTGDVTKTHIQWEHKKEIPSMASFLYLKPYLYTVEDGGAVQCFKGDSGEVVWRGKLKGHYCASPVTAGGHICFLSEEGAITVIKAGPEFQVIATGNVGETCQASPAIARGNLFIRTDKSLFCMGATR